MTWAQNSFTPLFLRPCGAHLAYKVQVDAVWVEEGKKEKWTADAGTQTKPDILGLMGLLWVQH